MPTPLLATKLHVPRPRAQAVARPRLLARLHEGLTRKLTLVSAPAGFGKTTLVSEWLAGCEHPAAWVSLDEADSNPTRFLRYVVAALQTVVPELGVGVQAALESPQPPKLEASLTQLINDVATLPDKLILVLDDYHLVDAKAVDDALGFLLEHLPPQLHLVITTREDPQLPLPRLRVRVELTEVRASDLRFTASETANFLTHGMDLNLSEETLALLETRTEGWVAGLQMAALSLRGHEDSRGFVEAFAGDNRYIVDYLVEEVLQRQNERVRAFLLKTSVLERLQGSLCDAVTGQEDGAAMLGTLERGNLFVVGLDDKREWYRFHHLFADVLRTYLNKEHRHAVPVLHERASAWYEQKGFMPDAVSHALAAQDFERSARLIELSWRAMDVSFQSDRWLAWVRQLPEKLVRIRPVLSVGYAWALLNTGEFIAMEPWIGQAERGLDASPSERIVADEQEFLALPVTIASARAYKAQALGDISATIRHTAEALRLLPEDDPRGRAIPLALSGLAHWASGNLETAYQSLAEGLAAFEATGDIMAAISGTFGLADLRLAQGRLREAGRVYERAVRLGLEHDDPPLRGMATLYLGLSEVCREQGHLEAAQQHLLESEKRAEFDVQNVYDYRRCLAKALAKEVVGNFGAALELLDEAARHQEQLHVPFVRPVAALKARVWLKQGNLIGARAWADERGLAVADELSYLQEFEHLTLARLLIAQNEAAASDAALGLLVRLLRMAEAGNRTGSVIEILTVQALAYQARGDTSVALEALGKALTLAEPEGYVRTFVLEGAQMVNLLSALKGDEVVPGYAAKLLAAFETQMQPSEKRVVLPDTSLLEPLSERELEVLRLVAQGLSNRDIARRLYRALDTVKGYNRSIYGKLQVKSRTEAVAKARELGLL